MSLYALQKAIYQVNRDSASMSRFKEDARSFADGYELTDEEHHALVKPDIGLLYVLGVNGQLLMHFAAACGYGWGAYLDAMRQGLADYGPVREGLYAMIGEKQ